MTVELMPIMEKGGHRIRRIVSEHFRGWCATCDRSWKIAARAAEDAGYAPPRDPNESFPTRETETEARDDLANHAIVWHEL